MFSANRTQIAVTLCCLLTTTVCSAQDKSIEFDVPAVVGAREILPSPFEETKIIEVILPVSTAIAPKLRGNVNEFRFDVSWNQGVYPIFDYGPRTQTATAIKGLLTVEKNESQSFGIDSSLTGTPVDLASINLSSDLGSSNSERKSYQEIPQHDVLVASGTIDRGTGAFFRFHPSKTQTLEGSHDLILAFRVPKEWRNGMLKVECRGIGKRKVIGLWSEPFEVSRSFVAPLYLESNSTSHDLAIGYARAEQEFRKSWQVFEKELRDIRNYIPPRVPLCRQPAIQEMPHLLIQSGDDKHLSHFEGYLTDEVAIAAGKFVQARNSLKAN
ncbi:hypothetical protein [Mariniblastus fucicola]|uniref:Secreted protein n=1 Tax=Mariniblastus fucicola TaxID=980251 RepID=A0A5B9PPN3_9BACT|nr:hypothetical protein [Mariniblastus fucicola]QEG24233.1 hypothetical protein MFFC18_41500 [Mariniblastus fucicola]